MVETAYPFTLDDDTPAWENVIDLPTELVPGYPATPAGQASALRAVQDVVASAPGGRGLGTVYWEPAWTSVEGNGWDPADPASGNAWENQAMFGFDGRLLPVAAELAPDKAAPAARTASTTSLRVDGRRAQVVGAGPPRDTHGHGRRPRRRRRGGSGGPRAPRVGRRAARGAAPRDAAHRAVPR